MKLTIVLKFVGVYLAIIIAGILVFFGKEIGNTILLLATIMTRDLYRQTTGRDK